MANSYALFADLKARRCSHTAKARNTNRNSSRSGELMSLDMLLIDENSTLMQASIAAAREVRFRQSLTEGSVYSLAGFDVTRSNPKYRLSDAATDVNVCVSMFDSQALAFQADLIATGESPE
ncbi:unnamed protein product [Eruca vesicaria subsp. sativa]|uniref:Uncharacterized protein n=1 Tax=Eruca vesicaria subsp. sativa TaxID=29727 RepID=A0ABC8L098_ERUVS|nr:unnamed protein product [Eruca vesicaria subsp. sativa]